MRRWWKLALGVLVVLVIGFWDFGRPSAPPAGTGAAAAPNGTLAPSTSPSPTASPTPLVPEVPGALQPVGKAEFTADFSSSALDSSIWDTCYPWMSQGGCQNFGNPEEAEWYLPSQVKLRGGMLQLTAERRPTAGTNAAGGPKEYDCRSGMVTTHPGFNFEYGFVQVVARIPANPGLWSAFWLAPSNYQWPPEMDMIEEWGDGAHAGSFFHAYPHTVPSNKGLILPFVRATGWHTFSMSWTRHQLTFFMDGKVTLIVHSRIPHLKMYLLADVADYVPADGTAAQRVGGAQNKCAGSMLIKSVKVWKR
jgi:beta-glucanase (GH16 family)